MPTTDTITIQSTLGDLVARKPARAKVFEKLGIDFCCGGDQTLEKACQEKGIEADTVLTVLLAAEANDNSDEDNNQKDWTKVSLEEIAKHIVETHHAYLAQELPRVGEMVNKISEVHGNRHPYLRDLRSVFTSFSDGMNEHSKEEEEQEFPMIRAIEKGEWKEDVQEVEKRINKLITDHQGAGSALEKMRKLTDGFTTPEDGCGTFRFTMESLARMETDTHQHIHLENSVLFPRAIEKQKQLSAVSS